MRTSFNIYCDESCHLPSDHQKVMVLGAITVPADVAGVHASALRGIKAAHGVAPSAEIKWGKASPRWQNLYLEVVDYFFDAPDLRFRAVVADKTRLDHGAFEQTHDEWYFKMYYLLLSKILESSNEYRVYLDIKDTRSAPKVRHLHDILCRGMHDFREESLTRIQTVRSHEVQLMQVADILIGATSYANRDIQPQSEAKRALVQRIRKRSGRRLTASTPRREEKLNLFHWTGQHGAA